MPITDEIRHYLARRYDCDPHDDIRVDGQSIHVTGRMPNSIEFGEFCAGDLGDIQRDLEREAWFQSTRSGAGR